MGEKVNHEHICPTCGESWNCTDKDCDLPDEHVCPDDVDDEDCWHECVICGYEWSHTGDTCDWLFHATCQRCGIPSDKNFDIPNILRQVLEKGVSLLNEREFEELSAEFFEIMGYKVSLTPVTGDEGIDLFIRLGDNPTFSVAQCKHWETPIGAPTVREFYGAMVDKGATRGFLITTNGFTEGARAFAEGKPIVLARGQSIPICIMSIIAKGERYFLLRSKGPHKQDTVEHQETLQKPSVEVGRIILPQGEALVCREEERFRSLVRDYVKGRFNIWMRTFDPGPDWYVFKFGDLQNVRVIEFVRKTVFADGASGQLSAETRQKIDSEFD